VSANAACTTTTSSSTSATATTSASTSPPPPPPPGATNKCLDAIVFKKIRELLGGRVSMMLTGSAPLAIDVQKFVQSVFNSPVRQVRNSAQFGAQFGAIRRAIL